MGLFSKTPPPPPPKTVIGPRTTLRGTLLTRVPAEVHGSAEGPVSCKATLTVERGGRLKGDVACETLDCRGDASGKATVSGLTSFGEGASWEGELKTARLEIKRGASIEGTISPPATD